MKISITTALLAASLTTAATSHAIPIGPDPGPGILENIVTEAFSLSTPTVIPDGDLSGLVQSITPATSITSLDAITITLETTGGWNGDLYAYLWHDGEISVLINRTGRTAGNTAGSPTSSMVLTLADTAASDIHIAAGGFAVPLSGTFQPSGRAIDPLAALDTSPRTAGLSVFAGAPAAGEYRLFIADVAAGDTATLTNWGITLTGQQIPEPGSAALGLLAAAVPLLRRRRSGASPAC